MQTFRASDTGLLRIVVPIAGRVRRFVVRGDGREPSSRSRRASSASASLALAGFAVLFGPQMMRLDLRGDLEHLEVLKTWPVRSSAVIRGQILWPACVVTAIAWIGVVCAAMFSGTAFPRCAVRLALGACGVGHAGGPGARRRAIRRATTPSRCSFRRGCRSDSQRARGVDAMGQRLIMLAGIIASLLVFALARSARGRHRLVRVRPTGSARPVLVPATAALHADRADRSAGGDRTARSCIRAARPAVSGTRRMRIG